MASPDGDVPTELEAPPAPRHGFVATYGLIAIIVVVVLLADQLTKSWAVSRLSNDLDGIHIVGSLHLRLAFNSGMAFSKGEGKGPLIGAIALGIVGAMVWFARSVHDTLSRVAIGLVIGGALGNLCDRLFRGGLPRSGFLGGRGRRLHVPELVADVQRRRLVRRGRWHPARHRHPAPSEPSEPHGPTRPTPTRSPREHRPRSLPPSTGSGSTGSSP